MAADPSRWWYALIPFPVMVLVRYALVGVITLLLPTAGPSRAEALPVLLLGLAASLAGALVIVTAPVFVAGLVLDIRALRTHSVWTPNWGYAALGLAAVVGLVINWVALLSIPAAAAYLGIRRREVGHPLGGGQPASGTPTSPDRQDVGAPESRWRPKSRWGYGVVVPPALELTGRGALWAVRTTGLLRQGSDPLTLLVPVAALLVAVGLVPVFAVSLYLDASAVGDASAEETPDPQVWGLLGIASLLSVPLFRLTLMPLVALAYGVRRGA